MYATVYNTRTKSKVETIIPDFFDGRDYRKYTIIAGVREQFTNYTKLCELRQLPEYVKLESGSAKAYYATVKEFKSFNWMQIVDDNDYAVPFSFVQQLFYWLDTLVGFYDSEDEIIIIMDFD